MAAGAFSARRRRSTRDSAVYEYECRHTWREMAGDIEVTDSVRHMDGCVTNLRQKGKCSTVEYEMNGL